MLVSLVTSLMGFKMVFTNLPQIIIDWEVSKVARHRLQRGSLQRIKNKHKPDSWRIVYYVDKFTKDGTIKRIKEARTFGDIKKYTSEKAARIRADQILIELGINSAEYKPEQKVIFEDFICSYKSDILFLSKESTQSSEKSRIDKYLLPAFGKVDLELIGNHLVQSAVKKWCIEDELSVKSIKNIITLLQSILKTASDWGFKVAKFDSSVIKMPSRPIKPIGKSFTIDQAKHIINKTPYPYNIMMSTALLTGLRLGELLGLAWNNIDLNNGTLNVRQTVWQSKIQTPKSEESERTIPLPETLIELLKDYKNQWEINKYGLLWTNEHGKPICGDNLRHRVLRPILDEMGLVDRIGFHAFRHLHGSLLISNGANIKIVQTQLGHVDSKTTMELYVDIVGDDHRDAIEKLATAVSTNSTKVSEQTKKSHLASKPSGSKP